MDSAECFGPFARVFVAKQHGGAGDSIQRTADRGSDVGGLKKETLKVGHYKEG